MPKLSERLLDQFATYSWTGNVRELENLVKRIVVLGDECSVWQELLSKSNAAATLSSDRRLVPSAAPLRGVSLKEIGRRAARAAERDLILQTLNDTNWNRRKASRRLQVSYKTLLNKMKECGLS